MNYSQYFITKSRDCGHDFICTNEEAPKELKDLIQDIHMNGFNCMPNDWIYRTIMEAFEELEESKLEDIDISADSYYSDLYKWFGEPFAHEFCQEIT